MNEFIEEDKRNREDGETAPVAQEVQENLPEESLEEPQEESGAKPAEEELPRIQMTESEPKPIREPEPIRGQEPIREPEPVREPEPPEKKKSNYAAKVAAIVFGVLLLGGTVIGLVLGIGKLMQGETASKEPTKQITAVAETSRQEEPAGEAASNQETTAGEATIPTNRASGSAENITIVDVSDVVDLALPSVVAITNTIVYENYWNRSSRQGYGGEDSYETTGSGSGIIIGDNGSELWIVTNNHVVKDASSLTITFHDGTSVDAYVKGTDTKEDLAVVGVNMADLTAETKASLRAMELGDSDSLRLGEGVIAIGNALGFGQSVTTGCISAVNRTIELSDGSEMTLLQTDAAINPGNSGGALLNTEGKLIGINVAKYSNYDVEGMGFAIPISNARDIIAELTQREPREAVSEDQYPYLGVQLKEITSSMVTGYGMPEGIMVYYVEEGSPAQEAGIQSNDIITSFDGVTVRTYDDLSALLQYYAGGTTVDMTVERIENGQYMEKAVTITLGLKSQQQ